MSEFINLVLSAYEPQTPTHYEAQNALLSMRNSNRNEFINLICESIQTPNLDQKAIILLLILSREGFDPDSESKISDQPSPIDISPEIISKYESILIIGMNDQQSNIRFHSSMSFGHFGFYCILRDPSFLTHILQLFELNKSTSNFVISFEKSLLYILEQTILNSTKKQAISKFIFSRLTIEHSPIEVISLNLQIILHITPSFLNFLTQDESNIIFQLLKSYSINFTQDYELTYYSFLIWSKIIDKNPSLISNELFLEIIEISILIVSKIDNESNLVHSSDDRFLDKKDLTKLEIFKFWNFSIYSNCPLTALIPPYLPQFSEFGLKSLLVPSLDEDAANTQTECASQLLASIIFRYPCESTQIFLPFIEANIQNQEETSNPLFHIKSQYDAFVLIFLMLQSESVELFLNLSIQTIQIALNSPIDQIKIIGLNIISQITQFFDIEPIASQIDFISFLPVCLNFFKTGIQYFQNESISTIDSIVSAICSIEDDEPNMNSNIESYRNFNIIDLIKEVLNLIQPTTSSTNVKSCLILIDGLVKYVTDFDSLFLIFQFTFQLTVSIYEVNPNDSTISSSCALLSTILKNKQKFTFPIDLVTPLFQLLLNLQHTENGDQAIFTIGAISCSLRDAFQPMLEPTISVAIQNIDNGQFVRHSLACIQFVMASINTSFAIPDISKRLFAVLSDENLSGNDYILSYQNFRIILVMYYDLFASDSVLLSTMIECLNNTVDSLSDMIDADKETALLIAYLVFELYSILFLKNLKQYFHSISNHFFILASSIITINNRKNDDDDDDDNFVESEIPSKFIGQLIVTSKLMADFFGPSVCAMLEKSHIIPFLMKVASECSDTDNANAKNTIDYILSTVRK